MELTVWIAKTTQSVFTVLMMANEMKRTAIVRVDICRLYFLRLPEHIMPENTSLILLNLRGNTQIST